LASPQKNKPVKHRTAEVTTHGTPRKLSATKVGTWQMLCLLIRYQAGEGTRALGAEFGVSHQTIVRWQRAWGNDTRHVHKAAAQAVLAHELIEAKAALDNLKRQLDRGVAVVNGVLKRHNVRIEMEELYPEGSLELKSTKAY